MVRGVLYPLFGCHVHVLSQLTSVSKRPGTKVILNSSDTSGPFSNCRALKT